MLTYTARATQVYLFTTRAWRQRKCDLPSQEVLLLFWVIGAGQTSDWLITTTKWLKVDMHRWPSLRGDKGVLRQKFFY